MKLDVKLPEEFEKKWKRLRAYLDDDQILALAAVDLLWEQHGKYVCRAERLKASQAKRLRECKRRLDGLQTRKVRVSDSDSSPVFVGRFRRRLGDNGLLALPSAWLDALGDPPSVCLCRRKSDGEICLLSDHDADALSPREAAVMRREVDVRGRISVPAEWQRDGMSDSVVLVGKLRYVLIVTSCGRKR